MHAVASEGIKVDRTLDLHASVILNLLLKCSYVTGVGMLDSLDIEVKHFMNYQIYMVQHSNVMVICSFIVCAFCCIIQVWHIVFSAEVQKGLLHY